MARQSLRSILRPGRRQGREHHDCHDEPEPGDHPGCERLESDRDQQERRAPHHRQESEHGPIPGSERTGMASGSGRDERLAGAVHVMIDPVGSSRAGCCRVSGPQVGDRPQEQLSVELPCGRLGEIRAARVPDRRGPMPTLSRPPRPAPPQPEIGRYGRLRSATTDSSRVNASSWRSSSAAIAASAMSSLDLIHVWESEP